MSLLAASIILLVGNYVTCNLRRNENEKKWIEQTILGLTYAYQGIGISMIIVLAVSQSKYPRFLVNNTFEPTFF